MISKQALEIAEAGQDKFGFWRVGSDGNYNHITKYEVIGRLTEWLMGKGYVLEVVDEKYWVWKPISGEVYGKDKDLLTCLDLACQAIKKEE